MYIIRITSNDKKNLPTMMLDAIKNRRESGLLNGLIHIKDDIVREVSYGWEMVNHWDTPEEVAKL